MKRCPSCGETKDLDSFYRNRSMSDGRNSYCKVCWRRRVEEYRIENPEKYQSYIAKRTRRTPNNNKWRDEHRAETSAHRKVDWEIRQGRMKRPESCSECGKEGRVEAHHEDYDRPLDLTWLCTFCHRQRHLKVIA